MLERLLQLAGPDTTVMLVSDHGFHCDHLRPRGIPKVPAGPAVCHRHLGIFCLEGPHIVRDERIYGATLLDVTPTLLTLFGLPVGQDMDGKPLLQALEEPVEIESIPSWEDEPGNCGMHPADMRLDPASAQAVLDQFVALGYIQPPGEDQAKAVATSLRERNYNLARDYLDARKPHEALPLLEELVEKEPEQARFAQHLAQCYITLGRWKDARKILEGLLEKGKDRPWADLLMGIIEYEDGDLEKALGYFLKAEEANPRLPTLHLRLGNVHLKRGRLVDAERAFEKAFSIDPDSANANLGLAAVHLRLRRHKEAAQKALTAVSIQHFLPQGHYSLGVALVRLGHLQRARLAFETALSMAPGMVNTHRWLAALHSRPGGDFSKAAEHRRLAAELRQKRQAALAGN
jgi:tetratricopeptide (TPR) repeat protein